jgi:cell division protein FtsZ
MVEQKQVEMRQRPRPVVLRTGTGNEVVDYAQPEPAISANPRSEAPARSQDNGLEYLDIPAFLRRQAD